MLGHTAADVSLHLSYFCFLAQCLGLIARHMMCCANPCQPAQVCPSASALVRRIQLYTGQLVLKCAKTCISRASGGQSLITSGQPEGLSCIQVQALVIMGL